MTVAHLWDAEWQAKSEAALDAEEDRIFKPTPLGTHPTEAEREAYRSRNTFYKQKLAVRTARDEKRTEVAKAFDAAHGPRLQAIKNAETSRLDAEDAARHDREAQHADEWRAELQARYLSQPGATAEGWQADQAEVIKSARLHALQVSQTEVDQNRARIAHNYE